MKRALSTGNVCIQHAEDYNIGITSSKGTYLETTTRLKTLQKFYNDCGIA
jgi:hypothetical protein